MNIELLAELKKITPEEERILSGEKEIDKELYMSSQTNQVDSKKLLEAGKLIQVRTHTRFVHFPSHTHNFVEVIYMCSGSTHHIINGTDVILKQGELLFLNQNAVQEILPAGREDIAVNFIILPEFFDYTLKMLTVEENLVRDFLVDCLRGDRNTSGYLHFMVAGILPIQNLVENLIWTIVHKQPNKRSINQATMGVLFLQLMNHADKVAANVEQEDQQLMITVLAYIEENYKDGNLQMLANTMHYDLCWLSKQIKKLSGKTFTQLIQIKRLNQAAYLLTNTRLSVMEVGLAVGYDNLSYFHHIFLKRFQTTPKKYRVECNSNLAGTDVIL